jgi:hypothetical protein
MRQSLSVTPVDNLSATLSASVSVALACRRAERPWTLSRTITKRDWQCKCTGARAAP